ncbi:MAG: magnesium transporter [Acidobacteriota bacterium]
MDTGKKFEASAKVPVSLFRKLLHRGARANVAKILSKAYPVDVARLLSSLGSSERAHSFSILMEECEHAHAAAVLTEMETAESVALLETLAPKQIARLLGEMADDDATLLASRLEDPLASEVLAEMEAEPAADVRELLEHEERTAGRMMTRDFFALDEDLTVAEAVTALQRRSEEFEMVLYVYVVDKRNHLVGVVSLRQLLITPPATQLKRIMSPNVISAKTTTDQEEVARLVAEYNLLAIPIVDDEDKLVGIVTVDDALDVAQEEVAEDLMALAGVATEEHLSTSALRSLRLRLPWLLVNLVTAFLAATVISLFEDQIKIKPALAALMPIVAGMGGNAATQTLTILIRGIALGELTAFGRVFLKSIAVGAGIGIINGLAASTVAALYYQNFWLGVVLASAMFINMIVAGIAGTLIPVVLRRLHIDPAVASSVFVTTCTDVCGFFSFLGIATLLMRLL